MKIIGTQRLMFCVKVATENVVNLTVADRRIHLVQVIERVG